MSYQKKSASLNQFNSKQLEGLRHKPSFDNEDDPSISEDDIKNKKGRSNGLMLRTKPKFKDDNREDDDENNEDSFREKRRSHMFHTKSRSRSEDDLKKVEFGWTDIETLNSVPPNDYTVTHINQNQELVELNDIKAAPLNNTDSSKWMKTYCLEAMNLTLKDLLAKGVVCKPVSDKTGKAVQHITFDATDVNEFEYKLNLALEMYSKRIKWLTYSSRKQFGLIQGDKVAVLIDSSNANMGFGRAIEIQDSLLNLINEQLAKKKQFYFLTYGTDATELWDDTLRDIHHRTLEEAKVFITQMKPSGGSNLMKALKKSMTIKNADSIVLILGSVPDQNMDLLIDFMYQIILNKKANLHCVSYELNNHIVNSALKKFSEDTGGRYHCFSNSQEELIYNSTDINILLKEIKKVQDCIARIAEMKKGTFGSALIKIDNEVSLELEKFPQAKFLPRPRGHDLPLRIEESTTSGKMSCDWIEQHGLKAKKLNLYQVLAPNAYSYMEDYVPILNKTVQSQVHEKAMIQFTWHDGTTKNLHVDLASLYDFQKRLKGAVRIYEKRIDWLSSGSRKIFGSIAEDSVVILIDLSMANANYLVHIQHSLRLLMEQQIVNRKCFNLIGFGRTIKRWKPTVVKPTPALLQDAWNWVLDLQCEGTHNVLGALKSALENEEEIKHNINIDGLYLFTSGIPDQPIETLCAYLEESACGKDLKLHCILFNVDDYDGNGPIPGRWANITKTAEALRLLAHCVSGGRFHWFRETGIIESDDIKQIQQEIDKAVDFSRKASHLVETIKRKTGEEIDLDDQEEDYDSDEENRRILKQSRQPLPPPKPTTLSLQRMQLKDKDSEDVNKQKSLPWRPNSSKVEYMPIVSKDSSYRPQSSKSNSSLSRTSSSAKTEQFYMSGTSNSKGIVIRQSQSKASKINRGVQIVAITDKEENLTTKDWLKRYSLVKLKLDLHKLVSGPECKHDTITIGNLKKDVAARYCSTFPSININGQVRHLNLKQGELKEYQSQCENVIKRYVKRLQWLLSGSRRLFGTFVHEKIAILIDTSGSMNDYMNEVKKELGELVWEQLYKHQISFNLIRFSDRCEKWREGIVESTEENCHQALAWISTLTAHGNSCTLDALKEAFSDDEIDAIYLITDGKPDNSTKLVLDEVRKMNTHRCISINVISFNCDEKSANYFLSQLASENYGRFHKSSKSDNDIHLFAHKILTEGIQDSFLSHIPDFEGDDLRRLANEINKAKQFLKQAIIFRQMYDNKNFKEEIIIGPIHINGVKEDVSRHRHCVPSEFLM